METTSEPSPGPSFHTLRRCFCGAIPITGRGWEEHRERHRSFREAWDFQPEGSRLEEARSWAMVRRLTLERDEFRCRVCNSQGKVRWRGWRLEPVGLEVHHIIPLKDGGTHHPWNLITLCEGCHRATFRRDYKGVPVGRRWQRRVDAFLVPDDS